MKTFKSINIFYMKQYKKREELFSSLFKLIEAFKYTIMSYLNFFDETQSVETLLRLLL